MSSTCDICCENHNTTNHKIVSCPSCDSVQCRACAQGYILSNQEEPHCMACKHAWDRQFVDSWCTQKFRNTDLRRHREEVLFEREKALFPQAQVEAERVLRIRRVRQRIDTLRREIYSEYETRGLYAIPYTEREHHIQTNFPELHEKVLELRESYRTLDDIATRFGDDTTLDAENAPKFVRKCPNEKEDCRGYLSENYYCSMCHTHFCKHCNEKKTVDHVCNPDTVATMKLLKQDSKPCPKCGIFITKIEGCTQMWCTSCHCVWNFRTGLIMKGRVHNPHYIEYRRAGGELKGREHGDVPCGGVPSFRELREAKADDRILIYRIQLEMIQRSHDWIENENYSTRHVRLRYMLKMSSLTQFKREIQRIDKRHEKNNELFQLWELVIHATGDILRQYIINPVEIERQIGEINAVVDYANSVIRTIWKRYGCCTPGLVERVFVREEQNNNV